MVLFELSNGTKGKFRILQKKIKIFTIISVKNPQEIEKINQNKFFRVFLPVQIPYFWT
jgi:hypothetical protein